MKKTYPLGMSQSTSYDVANRRVSVTDFNGETTTSQYDNLGRVVTTSFPDGSTQSYSYTASGQIASVSGPQGVSRYSHDGDGRLSSVTDPNGATVSYAYDEFGRKQRVTSPSGSADYGYDQYGRLTSVTDADGNETRYTYDEHGNKARMISPNGTLTEYGYDNLNRLTVVETRTVSGTVLASYSYTLNAKGQRIHVEEQPTGRVIDYAYDAADRLIEERISDPALGNRTIGYSYDPVGNRLTKTDNGVSTEYSYDDNDRLLTESGYAYTYDNNGNMLSKTGNGEQWQLAYNALNQVTRANISGPQGSSIIDYTYDHDGIRIGKTINGTDITKYVMDKNRPYAQVLEEAHLHGGLSAVTSYVYGDALISSTIDDGINRDGTRFYHADGLGSVRGLSDSSGIMTDRYSYDAYGMLTGSSGASANPYRYRGEQYDSDLDAYYLRARYYQPETGRFLTTDPVEGFPTEPLSQHRYIYGNNDPVMMSDPSGRMSLNEAIVTTGIVGNLATFGIANYTDVGRNIWTTLAETIFPDAAILGISGNISLEPLRFLFDVFNVPVPLPDYYMKHARGFLVGGVELLMSFGSGQTALYAVGGIGTEIGDVWHGNISDFRPNSYEISGSVYGGQVYNLWNADNYSGWFESFSIGSSSPFDSFDLSLSWDPAKALKGPWGISQTIWSTPARWTPSSQRFSSKSFSYSRTWYEKWYCRDHASEYTVLGWVPIMMVVDRYLKGVDNAITPNNLLDIVATGTYWFQTAMSKNIFNKTKEYTFNGVKRKYSLHERQILGRPDDFQSGPGLFLFPALNR